MRVKRGFQARRRRKKILKRAKGFRGSNSRLFTVAIEKSDRALSYQYRDRRTFKNDIKKVWNHRIGQAVRNLGWSYSQFMGALKKANIQLNRKNLSHLAVEHSSAFESLVNKLRA